MRKCHCLLMIVFCIYQETIGLLSKVECRGTNAIFEWSFRNNLRLNHSKLKVMIFRTGSRLSNLSDVKCPIKTSHISCINMQRKSNKAYQNTLAIPDFHK